MNINRHNYEEYFLLYVDGELQPQERAEVEAFAAQNPDLAQELDMLKETVLAPEFISFDDKELLFKNEEAINKSNYEEFFLLSVDNELDKDQSAQVEKFVLQNPQLQDEFTILKQTKLPVETIPYPNKEELYRSEERERKVVVMRWLRIAAAAAVILISGVLFFKQDDVVVPEQTVAVNQPKPATKQEATTTTSSITAPATEQVARVEEKKEEVKQQPEVFQYAKVQVRPAQPSSPKQEVKPEEKVKLLPPTEEMIAYQIRKDEQQKNTTPVEVIDRPASMNSNVIAANNNNAKPVEQIVSNAVYKEFEEDEESKVIYIGGAEINKNKLKSLFRKASTLFEKKDKNSNDDERTINIANLQFKTK